MRCSLSRFMLVSSLLAAVTIGANNGIDEPNSSETLSSDRKNSIHREGEVQSDARTHITSGSSEIGDSSRTENNNDKRVKTTAGSEEADTTETRSVTEESSSQNDGVSTPNNKSEEIKKPNQKQADKNMDPSLIQEFSDEDKEPAKEHTDSDSSNIASSSTRKQSQVASTSNDASVEKSNVKTTESPEKPKEHGATEKIETEKKSTAKESDKVNSKEENSKDNNNSKKSDDKKQKEILVDYASKSVGALILDKSPYDFKGTSNLLISDRDRYAIAPCESPDNGEKYVVLGLSEDILVKTVKLSNFERYSSHVHTFQILGSQTYPIGEWDDLGTYTVKTGEKPNQQTALGQHSFDLVQPGWARYLKFRFLKFYGNEHYCTVSQIQVHGSTTLQGFHEMRWEDDLNMDEEEDEQIGNTQGHDDSNKHSQTDEESKNEDDLQHNTDGKENEMSQQEHLIEEKSQNNMPDDTDPKIEEGHLIDDEEKDRDTDSTQGQNDEVKEGEHEMEKKVSSEMGDERIAIDDENVIENAKKSDDEIKIKPNNDLDRDVEQMRHDTMKNEAEAGNNRPVERDEIDVSLKTVDESQNKINMQDSSSLSKSPDGEKVQSAEISSSQDQKMADISDPIGNESEDPEGVKSSSTEKTIHSGASHSVSDGTTTTKDRESVLSTDAEPKKANVGDENQVHQMKDDEVEKVKVESDDTNIDSTYESEINPSDDVNVELHKNDNASENDKKIEPSMSSKDGDSSVPDLNDSTEDATISITTESDQIDSNPQIPTEDNVAQGESQKDISSHDTTLEKGSPEPNDNSYSSTVSTVVTDAIQKVKEATIVTGAAQQLRNMMKTTITSSGTAKSSENEDKADTSSIDGDENQAIDVTQTDHKQSGNVKVNAKEENDGQKYSQAPKSDLSQEYSSRCNSKGECQHQHNSENSQPLPESVSSTSGTPIRANENKPVTKTNVLQQQASDLSLLTPEMILDLSNRYPSVTCLSNLNFSEWKNKFKSASSNKGSSTNQVNTATQTQASLGSRNEPIFKKLTDEMKSLKGTQSMYESYIRSLSTCYNQVLMEVVREQTLSEQLQAQKIRVMEDQIASLISDYTTFRENNGSEYWKKEMLNALQALIDAVFEPIYKFVGPYVDEIKIQLNRVWYNEKVRQNIQYAFDFFAYYDREAVAFAAGSLFCLIFTGYIRWLNNRVDVKVKKNRKKKRRSGQRSIHGTPIRSKHGKSDKVNGGSISVVSWEGVSDSCSTFMNTDIPAQHS